MANFENNLDAYNEVEAVLGGAGAQPNDIVAVRAIAVLEGVSGGPVDVREDNMVLRLNAIDVGAGGPGAHLNTLDALNSIVVLKGGVGGHFNDLDAINEWVDFASAFPLDPVGLIAHYDFLEGDDDQILFNLVSGGLNFHLGADTDPSTDDPTWVTGRPTVGLDFDGGDICTIESGSITMVGDCLIGFCAHFDLMSGDAVCAEGANVDNFQMNTTTSINFRLDNSNHIFTPSTMSLTKYITVLARRVGTNIDIHISGVLLASQAAAGTNVQFQTIGALSGPSRHIDGRIADLFYYSSRTFTDEELVALETDMKNRVKARHGLLDSDFA